MKQKSPLNHNQQIETARRFWSYFKVQPPIALTNYFSAADPNQNFTKDETQQYLSKLARQYIPVLRFIPGIQAVAVCNSLALQTVHKNSDIDLFIVCHPKLLFTARMLTSIYFQLLRKRRHHDFRRARFCLSFYISSNHLDLNNVALSNDYYLYYWILTLQWVLTSGDENKWRENFLSANQSWLKSFISEKDAKELSFKLQRFPAIQKRNYHPKISFFIIFLWQPFEFILKKYQFWRAEKKQAVLKYPKGVVISDRMLKFHVVDKRHEINQYVDKIT